MRGDGNVDGKVSISDAVWILNEGFRMGPASPCQKAADANDDGTVDYIVDAAFIVMYLFESGSVPPAPFGACGVDPTADSLSCESFWLCEPVEQPGCTDPEATHYDSGATVDDGSCEYASESFTFLGVNEQGYREYKDPRTGIVFVLPFVQREGPLVASLQLQNADFDMGSPDTELWRLPDEGPGGASQPPGDR